MDASDERRYDLPNCFYLVSTHTAAELSDELRKYTSPAGRYLITEISDNRQGWLASDTWYLFKNKSNKPKK